MKDSSARRARLQCALYDSRKRTRTELQPEKAIEVKGLAPVDRAINRIWIRVPAIRDRFTARFELLSDKNELLAFADSKPFLGGRSGAALAARPASRTEARALRRAIDTAPDTDGTRGKYRVAPPLVSTRGPWAFADLVPRRGYALDVEPAAAVLRRVRRHWRFDELLAAASSACADTHMPAPVVEGLGLLFA